MTMTNFDWRTIAKLMLVCFGLILVCSGIVNAEPNGSYVLVDGEQLFDYGPPNADIPYIHQGDVVYVNSTIDISGVVPPYPYLAYWDGYDMYDDDVTFQIELPNNKAGYYKFYLDPSIFQKRTGRWYKYDGEFEKQGYNLAFIVSPLQFRNYTQRDENGTLVNISEELTHGITVEKPIIKFPAVPIKHVSDYLVARGDSFNLTVTERTNIWLFGRNNQLLDYRSVNNSIDISSDVLSKFEPGSYTLIQQTIRNGTNGFTVNYNAGDNTIKWFDPKQFVIHTERLDGYSPQVTVEKFKSLIPNMYDDFKIYKFELQEPSLEIVSVEEKYNPNQTTNQVGQVVYNTNTSFIEVKGYTNLAPASLLTFYIDEGQTSIRHTGTQRTATASEGTYSGDMRWFVAYIPIDKYGIAPGEHTISGYTELSKSGTKVTFNIYQAPENTYVPPKVIRYVSGDYGPQEFIPTPTPITVEKQVIKEVIKEVKVEVTPSNEQVKAQQGIVVNEKIGEMVGIGVTLFGLGIAAMIIGFGIMYVISVYRRGKKE